MDIKFLCPAFREQLLHNHKQAISCWQQSFDTAENLIEDERWREALPYIGCAFETADIVLRQGVGDVLKAYEHLLSSAVLLGLAFRKLDYVEHSIDVYLIAIDCFERQLLLNFIQRDILMAHLHELHFFIESTAIPDGHFSNRHYSTELCAVAH